jgi:predicted TPR repeat methyltransferase
MSGIRYTGLGAYSKDAAGAVQLYDEWVDDYDKCLISWGYEAPQRIAALMKERGVPMDGAVLDLGCGTGLSGVGLIEAGFTGAHVGVDVSPKSIDWANEKKIYKGGAYVGSLEDPLSADVVAKGPYAAVICVGTLSYVHNLDVFWSECLKVLKPGGLVIVTHRDSFWDDDRDDCQTSAAKYVISKEWCCDHVSGPMPYMPENPEPEENRKRIKYIVYKKTGGGLSARALAEKEYSTKVKSKL